MKSWFAIVDFIGLFVLMIITATIYNRMDIYEQEYNAQRLSKATEYSTEAAFSETLAQNTADTDYSDLLSVRIDTNKTLGTFDDMMCFNYGLTRTDRSRSAIEDSIRTGVLAAKDGFYVLTLGDDGENGKKLMWTPKLPYSRERSGTDQTISYDLYGEEYREAIYNKSDGSISCKYGLDGPSDLRMDKAVFSKEQRIAVSSSITDAVTWSVDHNDMIRGEAEFGSYIPSKQTTGGINAITAPTLMFILQGGGYTGEVAHENVALTGFRAIHKVRTIGYIKNGKKMYCWEWQSPDNINILEYFNSPEEAASHGYVPDYDNIFRKIDYITK